MHFFNIYDESLGFISIYCMDKRLHDSFFIFLEKHVKKLLTGFVKYGNLIWLSDESNLRNDGEKEIKKSEKSC